MYGTCVKSGSARKVGRFQHKFQNITA